MTGVTGRMRARSRGGSARVVGEAPSTADAVPPSSWPEPPGSPEPLEPLEPWEAAEPARSGTAGAPHRRVLHALAEVVGALLGPALSRRAWTAVAHTALAVVVGVPALAAITPVLLVPYALLLALFVPDAAAATFLGILAVSAFLLWPALALTRVLAMLERRLVNRLLDVPPVVASDGRRWLRVVVEEATWRELLWLLVRVAVAALLIGFWVLAIGILGETLGRSSVSDESLVTRLLLVVMPVAFLLVLHGGRGIAWLLKHAARPLLGDVAAARLAAEQERSRRLEDRARLARELHDSVGHGVTLMVLQAGAARATPGDDGREALATIERSGRAVMADLHRVLGLLDPSAERAERDGAGVPWGRVEESLEAMSAAGVDVHRVVRDRPGPVPDDVESLVTRCAREAMTNAATHAPGGRVVVDLEEVRLPDGREVVLVVDNDPPAPGTAAPVLPSHRGSGLAGLAVDAGAAGGELLAGVRANGGFRVRLRVPVDRGSA